MRKKNKHVTQADIDSMKVLKTSGLSAGAIARALGYSTCTVGICIKADYNFEKYHELSVLKDSKKTKNIKKAEQMVLPIKHVVGSEYADLHFELTEIHKVLTELLKLGQEGTAIYKRIIKENKLLPEFENADVIVQS